MPESQGNQELEVQNIEANEPVTPTDSPLVHNIETASDCYPVADLFSRYGLSRAAVYSIRMNALQIKPFKRKGRAYITDEELRQLDRLHKFMANGGLINTFDKVQEITQRQYLEQLPSDSEPLNQEIYENLAEDLRLMQDTKKSPLEPEEIVQVNKGAITRVKDLLNTDISEFMSPFVRGSQQILAPISNKLGLLINAVEKLGKDDVDRLDRNIRILKDAVKDNIIFSTSQVGKLLGIKNLPSGKAFDRMGFTFTKDVKQGRETGWRVTKQSRSDC